MFKNTLVRRSTASPPMRDSYHIKNPIFNIYKFNQFPVGVSRNFRDSFSAQLTLENTATARISTSGAPGKIRRRRHEMRRAVADCLTLPYHDDRYLLRWLAARNYDPVAAEKMLRA
ncbi:hypothetical protein GE061_018012, partial [Apolygus lucorum]